MRFLIVEDDALLADGLARTLRAGGHIADCVASAEHAALALKNEAFDVVLLDLGLPGIDGYEVLARLRRGGNTVPVHRVKGTSGPGAGLGLAIVREIAHRHGASVMLGAGAGGRGTRVSLSFPAA